MAEKKEMGPRGKELHDFAERVAKECLIHMPEGAKYLLIITRETDLVIGGNVPHQEVPLILLETSVNLALSGGGTKTVLKMPEKV